LVSQSCFSASAAIHRHYAWLKPPPSSSVSFCLLRCLGIDYSVRDM
jgi:hypothetical protein